MSTNHLLITIAKKSPLLFLLSIAFGLAGAILNGIGVTLIIPLVMDILGQDIFSSSNFPPLLKSLFGLFERLPEGQRSPAMVSLLVGVLLLKNLATYGGTIINSLLSRAYIYNLRREGLELLLDVDLGYYANVRLGDLMSYLNTEVNRVATAVKMIARITTLIITILVFLGILIALSWHLTLVSSLLLVIIALANQLSVGKAKGFGQQLSRSAANLSNHTIEVLSGIRLVKTTANEARELAEIDYLVRQREDAEFKSQVTFASIGPINEMLSILAIIALIVAGRTLFTDQIQASSSVILTYLVVLFRLLPFVGQLNNSRSQLAGTSASVEVLQGFLNRTDKPFMVPGRQPFTYLRQGVRFNHISFRYPQTDTWALRDIDLTIPRGKTLALVGASGAGKSTLADLLPRFYDPTEGTIEIDGIDLKAFDIRSFRRRLGVVSQDTFLFNASVKDNIRYGYPEATNDDVVAAARRSNAEEFILKLPQGYDTMIGDRGILLSGGQRQRLAIARALVQNPDILILDEATSALDTISERLVQQAIDDLSQNRTTLVIAHRLSTVHKADQIAVLEHGQVVEVGTHQTLLARGHYYAKLYAMQFSEQPQPSAT